MVNRLDWKLNQTLLQKMDQIFGPLEVDLFASRLTTQLQIFFGWRPDTYAEVTDAFLQDWTTRKGFANPLWCMIGQTLSHVRCQRAQIVLMTPVWKSQPWYPVLLEMVIDYLRKILDNPVVIDQGHQRIFLQLAIWHISGRDILVKNFRRMLQHSCLHHGDQKLTNLTTHSLGDGVAGVGFRSHSRPITEVMNFLADFHKQGYQYHSLNCYHSAISFVHEWIDGHCVGEHPLVSRLMKGVFNDRPPLP